MIMLLNRKAERTATALLRLGDFVLVYAAMVIGWYLRFELKIMPLTKDYQPLAAYLVPAGVVALIWLLVMDTRGDYRLDVGISFGRELERLVGSSIVATVFTMALSFTYRGYSYSRLVLGFGALVSLLFLLGYHRFAIWAIRRLLARGVGVSRKLIIGYGEHSADVIKQLKEHPLLTKGLIGCLTVGDAEAGGVDNTLVVGDINNLRDILISRPVDEVILAEPSLSSSDILRVIYECRKEQVLFEMVPAFQDLLRGRVAVERIGSLSFIRFDDVVQTRWERVVKRAIDILISGALLILLSPLFLVTAILIKSTSSGTVFFTQERVGRNARRFKMLKFRSMYQDAEERLKELLDKNEAKGAIFKIKHDPRITPIGRFLRRFSIDELPQIINVFKGDMSLVGPRPPLPRELPLYKEWQFKRVDTVPGMTGLAQISGRSELTFEEMAELDIYYIEHWSLWLDMKILFKTIPAVLSGRGAY